MKTLGFFHIKLIYSLPSYGVIVKYIRWKLQTGFEIVKTLRSMTTENDSREKNFSENFWSTKEFSKLLFWGFYRRLSNKTILRFLGFVLLDCQPNIECVVLMFQFVLPIPFVWIL